MLRHIDNHCRGDETMSDIVARISNNIIEAEIVSNIFDIHIDGAVINTATSTTVSKVAGQTLSGHRAVCVKSDGKVYYADANTPSCKSVIGLTTHSAAINETVAVQTTGQLSNVGGWSFTPGALVFVGENGQIVSTPVGTAFFSNVGLAVSADTINIEVQPTILF